MLHQIIDRRLAGKNKSIANRERFLRRFRSDIRRSITGDSSIKDIESSKSITIPRKDISEPAFHHGRGGNVASNEGEGSDEFTFELSREEFMQYFFEDLELPRLIQT